jgi:predicted nucleic acid-binding protein
LQDTPLYISAITEIELFGFPSLSDQEVEQIEGLLRTVAVIPVDSRIARTAGLIRRTYRVNIADSVIAATALFTGTTLLTHHLRDFRKIPNLSVRQI